MEQHINIINRSHYLEFKEDINSEQSFLLDVDAVVEFSKPLESFDYLIRCQNNFKHAICMSAFSQALK
ncbi:hypothetical protein GCM10022246_02680 [Pedobacter ginsengiterrae]|uniref:Uncharacterized protein n=1 Tax=Pedobacter ginsengiterrae TaxID=871696 RepID=A0ABP7NRS4_9SPHI